jgi:hypothetical protein
VNQNRLLIHCCLVSSVLVAGVLAMALPAGAAPSARVRPAARATCAPGVLSSRITQINQDLSDRVSQLNTLTAQVNSSSGLTSSDKQTLLSDLSSELSGMQALQTKVPDETTCAAVIADGRAMVVDYRVYLVMTPQVHLTNSADTEASLASRLSGIEPALQAAIDAAQAKGQNVQIAQADYNDLVSQVTAAQGDGAGIASSVLAFTPASYPGCWSSFLADRSNLAKGQAALRRANKDLHQITQIVG